jgi:DNA-binding response OmpR family regulator
MRSSPSVLVVDADRDWGHALALLLRREGHRVRVVRTRHQALQACRKERYDVAVVDLFLQGGGAEVGTALGSRVGTLLLSLASRMAPSEVREAARGFPVVRKATLPGSLKVRRAAPRARSGPG